MIVSGTGYVTGPRAEASASLDAHLRYLMYRTGEEGGPRAVFSANADTLTRSAAHQMILDHGREGLRYHKLVISPAADERIDDWPAFTRHVLGDLGERLGLRLTWTAVVHRNTDHVHAHIVLAGDGQRVDGRPVRVRLYAPDYAYLRERARWHSGYDWDRLFKQVAHSSRWHRATRLALSMPHTMMEAAVPTRRDSGGTWCWSMCAQRATRRYHVRSWRGSMPACSV